MTVLEILTTSGTAEQPVSISHMVFVKFIYQAKLTVRNSSVLPVSFSEIEIDTEIRTRSQISYADYFSNNQFSHLDTRQ